MARYFHARNGALFCFDPLKTLSAISSWCPSSSKDRNMVSFSQASQELELCLDACLWLGLFCLLLIFTD